MKKEHSDILLLLTVFLLFSMSIGLLHGRWHKRIGDVAMSKSVATRTRR